MIYVSWQSHDLPSAGWRPSEAIDVIQSGSEGLRTRETDGINPSSRAGEDEMSTP